MGNRKLIRPSLKDHREKSSRSSETPSAGLTPIVQAQTNPAVGRRKQIPAEQTNAESFYYLKQMQTKTPMVITLQDGEQIRGIIEWYDRHCLKVNRHKEPNLMILKHNIKYIFKQEDEPRGLRRRQRKTKPAADQEPAEKAK